MSAIIKDKISTITDLCHYPDLPIDRERLTKIFHDLSESPEKVRFFLNQFFISDFQPTFLEPDKYTSGGLQDVAVDFLDYQGSEDAERPYRLIDIKTGKLVDRWDTGPMDSYCMLSHRWKGAEITKANIERARGQHSKYKKEGTTWLAECRKFPGKDIDWLLESWCSNFSEISPGCLDAYEGDLHLVFKQCIYDLLEQEKLIMDHLPVTFCAKNLEEKVLKGVENVIVEKLDVEMEKVKVEDIGLLLRMRTTAKAAKDDVNWMTRNWNAAKVKLERCRVERDIMDEKMKKDDKKSPGDKDEEGFTTLYEDAKKKFDDAETSLNNAQRHKSDFQEVIDYFSDNNELTDAADWMVTLIQRWKSAIKLLRSMEEAKNIFDKKVFRSNGDHYIWSDTCCIDKLNYGELSVSLSLMGDWYENAEFCVVQLDTTHKDSNAVADWELFQGRGSKNSATQKGNILSFSNINDPLKPEADTLKADVALEPAATNHAAKKDSEGEEPKHEWTTRAWTLQELVMSKVSFFFNSEWEPLSRPVESLGYVYSLIPFVAMYTNGIIPVAKLQDGQSQKCEEILLGFNIEELPNINQIAVTESNGAKVSLKESRGEDKPASKIIWEALKIIYILDTLGFKFPTQITADTAISEMSQSVYLAASGLGGGEDKLVNGNGDRTGEGQSGSATARGSLLTELKDHYAPDSWAQNGDHEMPQAHKEAQQLIDSLLVSLVEKTNSLIVSDREFIAKLGQVEPLQTWKQGIGRSGFPTQQVMQLACKRSATVAVDHAYSLMGILGVRFQSFQAEGYEKALCRLLDEVIIAYNDVSVFNWTGVEMGSQVRGRSMYPNSHRSYGTEEDRGRRYNELMAAEDRKQRVEDMKAYRGVIQLLQDATTCVKDKGKDGIPLAWVQGICDLIQAHSFDQLKINTPDIAKILIYIRDPGLKLKTVEEAVRAPKRTDSASGEKSGWSMNLTTPLSGIGIPTIETPKISKLGFGKLKPSFGRSQYAPVEEVSPPKVVEVRQVPAWQLVDRSVKEYLKNAEDEQNGGQSQVRHDLKDQDPKAAGLPKVISDIPFEGYDSQEKNTGVQDSANITAMDDPICPNPIIVNNAGIEGIFDIQRVIVAMLNPEKLHRQIAKATSPKQKISGWCTLSTGFANVAVNFSCEKRMLERQLEVSEAIEDIVIKEDRSKKVHSAWHLGKKKSKASNTANSDDPSGVNEDKASDKLTTKQETKEVDETAKSDTANEADLKEQTIEERTTASIIEFIQESDLKLVAGEWVLARFSGVPSANWFLCSLELGSTHQFYGRRIATTEIDFGNSIVESGLESAWKTYTERKKKKMCKLLDTYIKTFEHTLKRQEKLDMITGIGFKSTSPRSPTLSDTSLSDIEKGDNVTKDYESDEDFLDDILDWGKNAALALGEVTFIAGKEKLSEINAKYLDKHLAASVIKRTPKNLQSAVTSMDANQGLLPTMFHSSIRVHMF